MAEQLYEGCLKSSWTHHSDSELCEGVVTVSLFFFFQQGDSTNFSNGPRIFQQPGYWYLYDKCLKLLHLS
jgi:hypothetical protein